MNHVCACGQPYPTGFPTMPYCTGCRRPLPDGIREYGTRGRPPTSTTDFEDLPMVDPMAIAHVDAIAKAAKVRPEAVVARINLLPLQDKIAAERLEAVLRARRLVR